MKPIDYKKDFIRKPDKYDVQIGQNLLKIRVKLGYSQAEVGEGVGTSWAQIQKYEAGINRLSGSRMVHLADFFECQPADFFEGIGRTKRKSLSTKLLGNVDMHAAYAYQAIQNPKLKLAVLNMMRLMAGADDEE